jgi:HK97 family phage major capsid protein
MKLRKVRRSFSATDIAIDTEKRTATFSFSSETAVDQYFGSEILSHAPGACDLSRLNNAAPHLWMHDLTDQRGVVEAAAIGTDKRGYCTVRFSESEAGTELMNDMATGIKPNVSVGYRILEIQRQNPGAQDQDPIFLVTKWQPYEISSVSVPADNSVGLGRSDSDEELEVIVLAQRSLPTETKKPEGVYKMTEEEKRALEAANAAKIQTGIDAGISAERARIATITAIGDKHNLKDLARTLIDGNRSIEQAREAFMEKLEVTQKPIGAGDAMIDLSNKDQKNYSLLRGLRAQLSGEWKGAGFERELSLEIAKKMDKEPGGFFMPLNIKMDGTRAGSAGSYQAGSSTLGGNTVATNLLADSFIELLRNKMLVNQMGARTLSGLVGNVAIPRQSGAAAVYWIAELADVTESEGTFSQVTMSPKTVGARSQMSRQLILQGTPDIEMLVRSDLAAVIALGLDAAAISGLGTGGQPTGILNTSGIGSVAMGTNGLAFANLDPLIDLETLVATGNADFGSLGYMTTPGQVGKLKKLKDSNNNYLWNGFRQPLQAAVPGEINGYQVGRTNQMPSTLTKGSSAGNCSAAIFGNWQDLFIGQWGPGIEILANPFGAGFNSGAIDVRALASVDIAIRNKVSFAAITDLL